MSENMVLHEQNYSTGTRATLIFNELPDVSFTVTNFNIPGVNTSSARQATPFVDMPIRGDKLVFEPLSTDFIVLEDFSNWQELYNWIVGITAPRYGKEFVNKPHEYMDGTLTVYSSHNNPILEFNYKNLVITSISSITFNTNETDAQPLTCTATFDYQDYSVVNMHSQHNLLKGD